MRAFLFPNPTIQFPLSGILLLCPGTLLRWPTFCSCVPVLCSGGQPFYFRWSGILPPVARNSTSAAQDSAPTAHSISPKGHSPLRDSAFQFPTFSITLPKPTITTSRPTSHVTRAQKPRFCARKARKQGFQTPKAHKNLNFVLEKPENEGSRPQKRTKNSILCSKCPKTGVPDPKSAQKCRFCAREDGKVASGIVKVAFLQITAHAFKT